LICQSRRRKRQAQVGGKFSGLLGRLKVLRVFCGISGSASVPEIGFKKEQSPVFKQKDGEWKTSSGCSREIRRLDVLSSQHIE